MKEDEKCSGEVAVNACSVCHAKTGDGGTALLRCVRCRSQWYCSRDCQKKDWQQHKKMCKQRAQKLAVEAWNELQQIVLNTSPEEASMAFHRANDEIQKSSERDKNKIEKNVTEPGVDSSVEASAEIKHVVTVNASNSKMVDADERSNPPASDRGDTDRHKEASISPLPLSNTHETILEDELSFRVREPMIQSDVPPTRQPSSIPFSSSRDTQSAQQQTDEKFEIYIEELYHLSCYQLDIRPKLSADTSSMDLEHWSVQVSHDQEESSTVSLYNAYLKHKLLFRLLGRVNDFVDSVSLQKGCLSIRISVEALGESLPGTRASCSEELANQLCCSGCGTILVAEPSENESRVKRVLSLPSGSWDDMNDYLICYEGQPSIDFSSSSTAAQCGLVLEDSSVVVYHLEDLAPNVQVLAIPAYGESGNETDDVPGSRRALPLIRGNRSWSDAVGGATVTCSRCCLVLGVAPVELLDTVRLYKHLVVAGTGGTRLASIAHFCAHSMIRYADSKAIFSFLVRDERQLGKALLLQLVGWDRKAARGYKDPALGELFWSRLAKILFEERNNLPQEESTNFNMMWTQGDWCCPPSSSTGRFSGIFQQEEKKTERQSDLPTSYVSLWLGTREWMDLKGQLEFASRLYSDGVVSATFLAKNGRLPETTTSSGLAAIFLD
eukprot:scaffold2655_cov179-Amphora_coffeaeformis.AAC.24